jgi:hypothetical protein
MYQSKYYTYLTIDRFHFVFNCSVYVYVLQCVACLIMPYSYCCGKYTTTLSLSSKIFICFIIYDFGKGRMKLTTCRDKCKSWKYKARVVIQKNEQKLTR